MVNLLELSVNKLNTVLVVLLDSLAHLDVSKLWSEIKHRVLVRNHVMLNDTN